MEDTAESIDGLRGGITGRGSTRLGSMFEGEVGGEDPKEGRVWSAGAEMFRSGASAGASGNLAASCPE